MARDQAIYQASLIARSLLSLVNPKVDFFNSNKAIYATFVPTARDLASQALTRKIIQSYLSQRDYDSYKISSEPQRNIPYEGE